MFWNILSFRIVVGVVRLGDTVGTIFTLVLSRGRLLVRVGEDTSRGGACSPRLSFGYKLLRSALGSQTFVFTSSDETSRLLTSER